MIKEYKDDERIMLISGTNFLFSKWKSSNSFYFSNLLFTWGWASWRRAWNKMEISPKLIDKGLFYARYRNSYFVEYL